MNLNYINLKYFSMLSLKKCVFGLKRFCFYTPHMWMGDHVCGCEITYVDVRSHVWMCVRKILAISFYNNMRQKLN